MIYSQEIPGQIADKQNIFLKKHPIVSLYFYYINQMREFVALFR